MLSDILLTWRDYEWWRKQENKYKMQKWYPDNKFRILWISEKRTQSYSIKRDRGTSCSSTMPPAPPICRKTQTQVQWPPPFGSAAFSFPSLLDQPGLPHHLPRSQILLKCPNTGRYTVVWTMRDIGHWMGLRQREKKGHSTLDWVQISFPGKIWLTGANVSSFSPSTVGYYA